MGTGIKNKEKTNGTIDIIKLILAFLVVGIHTEPFSKIFWADKGFAVITRICVPFFFVASAYFYWKKEKSPFQYLKRIFILYLIWTIIYLPFDIQDLSAMSVLEILKRFFWSGNVHALWYLYGSIIGFIIVFVLLKFLSPKTVFAISIIFLIIGCAKSTWSPLIVKYLHFEIPDVLGVRNGLYYAFPYMSLGMLIAKRKESGLGIVKWKYIIGLLISVVFLFAESYVFVIKMKTDTTILWISVLPMTYFFFMLSLNTNIQISKSVSLFFRKASTLIYVSHSLFLIAFKGLGEGVLYFVAVSAASFSLASVIILLSDFKYTKWLRYLY